MFLLCTVRIVWMFPKLPLRILSLAVVCMAFATPALYLRLIYFRGQVFSWIYPPVLAYSHANFQLQQKTEFGSQDALSSFA
jgi:hypothetical protein